MKWDSIYKRRNLEGTTKENADSQEEGYVQLEVDGVILHGNLLIPEPAKGLVVFAHGSGSSRHSPRNQYVAQALREVGLATLLFDLLTLDEEAEDLITGRQRFDISLLARRLVGASDWLQSNEEARRLRLGYFGSSTGAAAASIEKLWGTRRVRGIRITGSSRGRRRWTWRRGSGGPRATSQSVNQGSGGLKPPGQPRPTAPRLGF